MVLQEDYAPISLQLECADGSKQESPKGDSLLLYKSDQPLDVYKTHCKLQMLPEN